MIEAVSILLGVFKNLENGGISNKLQCFTEPLSFLTAICDRNVR